MKVCFKCGIEKSLSDFYVHKQMGDGHLNKCKDCTKKDTKMRCDILRDNPDWRNAERERGRNKYHRLYSKYKKDITPSPRSQYQKKYKTKRKPKEDLVGKDESRLRYKLKYPEKHRANVISQHMKVTTQGNQKHHWSYNEKHYKDVIELTPRDHMLAHRHMIYDQERMMYRTIKGVLLDSRSASIRYYQSLGIHI